MTKRNVIFALIGLVAFYGAAFGGLAYSARTNPDGVDDAYGAVHGVVIQPYQGD